jgi:hypothetical protein
LRHPNKIFNSLMTCLYFEGFSHFVSTGGGRRRSVRYIQRTSPKNIVTTGKDCRSLSYTILGIQIFSRDKSDVAWILTYKLTCQNFIKKLIEVSQNHGKNICAPFCMKTFCCGFAFGAPPKYNP